MLGRTTWMIVGCVLTVGIGCRQRSADAISSKSITSHAVARPSDDDTIIQFCADCHELPDPTRFVRDRWPHEVDQGIKIYQASGRTDLVIPDRAAAVEYFRAAAPQRITFAQPVRVDDQQFVKQTVPWPGSQKLDSISSVRMLSGVGQKPQFLLTDMGNGAVTMATVVDDGIRVVPLTEVAHPAHIEPWDVDADGVMDYVIADLGTLNPQVEKQGSVWLLRGKDGQSNTEPMLRQPIKLGLSRVADVRPIDHDNDGDLDLIAADFGLHFVGSIYLGTNQGMRGDMPQYEWRVVDSRPGAISIPTVDFNGDGRMDFVALIAQQYETVELKLNRGDGNFESKLIFSAGDPASGTSSMQLIDFDNDGDLDVVHTNGDTFDDGLAKPFHMIRWLENEGTFPFAVHEVGLMPGCYHAVAGDIDGDGDRDIAAVAYLSDPEVAKYEPGTFDGVAWFEQIEPDHFIRHTLTQDICQAATCELMDWDGDGDLDLLVPPSSADRQTHAELMLFRNQLRQSSAGDQP